MANEVSYDVDSALTVSKTLLAYVKTAGPSAKKQRKTLQKHHDRWKIENETTHVKKLSNFLFLRLRESNQSALFQHSVVTLG